MKKATIKFDLKNIHLSEAISYAEKDEEKVIMAVVRQRVKEYIGGWKARFVPKGLPLMQQIVREACAYFKWFDAIPTCWGEFRCWAIRRGFLKIEEV